MRTIKEQGNISTIRFEAKLFKIGSWTLVKLPKSASAKLPSRGMTMVRGTINDFRFEAALEPDGKGSHWFRVDSTMRKAVRADAGDTVILEIEPVKEWAEPNAPVDLKNALAVAPQAHPMDADHAGRALGLDPLDKLNQTIGNTQATDRGGIVEAQGRRSKTMLFQPYHMY
jgi:hypothetical protein